MQRVIKYKPAKHRSHALLYGTDPEVTCLSYGALAQCLLGYPERAIKYGERAVQKTKKINHPFSHAFALNHHTWLYQFLRKTEQVNKFAGVYLENAQPEKALKWLESADARAQINDEHFFDAEIHRLKGEAIFISAHKNNKEGELLLWRAVEIARRQNLKIFELRALGSLVRHTEKKETIHLLRDIYKWFSEGKETYDLKQANNLIQSNR